MISQDLVVRVLLLELALITLILALVFGHALWYRRTSAQRVALLARCRDPLVAALATGDASGAIAPLGAMPRRVLVRLLADIAPSIVGPQRATVAVIADRLGLTASATRSLRSRLWWRRLQGARVLTLVGRDPAALASLRHDRHPLLRAQRAEMLGQHPSEAGAAELISMLADADGAVRFVARDALMRLGLVAQAPIVECLLHPEPTALPALLEVATAIASPELLPAALLHSASEDDAVRVRAAGLLRAIAGSLAIDRLVQLLADPAAPVRATAAGALGTLGHWPAVTRLARLLDDADWDVRIAASVALQRLGAPGELLLRRARDGGSGPGADVARQVLDAAEQLRMGVPA